jgi:hypothetical protein
MIIPILALVAGAVAVVVAGRVALFAKSSSDSHPTPAAPAATPPFIVMVSYPEPDIDAAPAIGQRIQKTGKLPAWLDAQGTMKANPPKPLTTLDEAKKWFSSLPTNPLFNQGRDTSRAWYKGLVLLVDATGLVIDKL